jgi:RNA polymerase sigma-70 factor (ECF subfamily)
VDERIVVVLRFEADLTVPSIATLTGVPEGTVKSRLHHALRKLRGSLGKAGR